MKTKNFLREYDKIAKRKNCFITTKVDRLCNVITFITSAQCSRPSVTVFFIFMAFVFCFSCENNNHKMEHGSCAILSI